MFQFKHILFVLTALALCAWQMEMPLNNYLHSLGNNEESELQQSANLSK